VTSLNPHVAAQIAVLAVFPMRTRSRACAAQFTHCARLSEKLRPQR